MTIPTLTELGNTAKDAMPTMADLGKTAKQAKDAIARTTTIIVEPPFRKLAPAICVITAKRNEIGAMPIEIRISTRGEYFEKFSCRFINIYAACYRIFWSECI